MSATFVSPEHGWVLTADGSVLESRDSGVSWRKVGLIPHPNDGARTMRFADSEHGFAFGYRPDDNVGRLWTTADGGAHWQQSSVPFGAIFDLEIARGVVYVVAPHETRTDLEFRIWLSPADHLAWKEDPFVMGPGAGPIITFQFAFSGAHGWLIENDRGPVDGAKRSADGTWARWKPPCADVGAGVVTIAASTATDIVASCEEGVWTGPPTRDAAYFSHDGGATFRRTTAPASGFIASPNAHSVVVGGGQGLLRTTDDGASWQRVASPRESAGYSGEIGFTTTTQGYAIVGDSQLLKTHDTGATWQPVMLP